MDKRYTKKAAKSSLVQAWPVSDSTFGNPENPLSYTTKSSRKIKQILNGKGYEIGHNVIGGILEELGYSLQLNQKMLQIGDEHPDRNTQFEFINAKAKHFLDLHLPVISIDAKKREYRQLHKQR